MAPRRGWALGLGALLSIGVLSPAAQGTAPDSAADCSQAGTRVEVTADLVLDPSCTYTAGFDVTASGVTLDCDGARIAGSIDAPGAGVLVRTPTSTELTGVTIRNCRIEGFVNSIKVTRDGFRDLAEGVEFEHPTSNILIEGNEVGDSHGVGIFVDGYVSDVTIRGNAIRRTGSSGIYLETGSKANLVEGNEIVDNGFIENGPGGRTFEIGGTTLWFWAHVLCR